MRRDERACDKRRISHFERHETANNSCLKASPDILWRFTYFSYALFLSVLREACWRKKKKKKRRERSKLLYSKKKIFEIKEVV